MYFLCMFLNFLVNFGTILKILAMRQNKNNQIIIVIGGSLKNNVRWLCGFVNISAAVDSLPFRMTLVAVLTYAKTVAKRTDTNDGAS